MNIPNLTARQINRALKKKSNMVATDKPVKFCTSKRRCDQLRFAMEHSIHGALEEMTVFHFKKGESGGTIPVIRLKQGRLGRLKYCPCCARKLVEIKHGA